MDLNWTGLIAALATFLGVWLGHVGVRRIEYISSTVWLPSIIASLLGVAFEIGALFARDLHISAALGIFGITLLWDGLEFWRQHRRVEKGHAPANPNNPRHARLLTESSVVTTIDWLDRDPVGWKLTANELQAIQEGES